MTPDIDYWAQRIERDLTPFVDPNTTVTVVRAGRLLSASWYQRQTPREAAFTVSPDSVEVMAGGHRVSYRTFFASPDMADLLGIAKMTLQARRTGPFIQTQAIKADDEETQPRPALEVIRDVLADPWASDATLVVMVTGEAGAGKTSVLEQLVKNQAELYLRGQAQSLFLYVNAQGRALARFQEALATELQDLRATLTYHAVSTLVRLGLLVPVIDGFDELLGIGGYDDAFSSLATFIEELDGAGQLIASARSTYYEQEFVARANRVSGLGSQVWKQIPVKVLAWRDEERSEYIKLVANSKPPSDFDTDLLTNRVLQVFTGRNQALGEKPLFVARATQLALDGIDLSPDGDLLEQMVKAYVDRESGKLLDRNGGKLLTPRQIHALLVELAEEMWNQETRELDARSIREIAEYVLVTGDVAEPVQQIVIAKMPSFAFLRPGERPGSIAFEHETFFAFFLGRRLAELIGGQSTLPATILGRSVLPDDVAEAATIALSKEAQAVSVAVLLERISTAASTQSARSGQIRENAGLLVANLLRRQCSAYEPTEHIVIKNVVLPGQSLNGVFLQRALLEDVTLRRVDLTHTRILDSCAKNVTLLDVLVEPGFTRLELSGLNPAQVIGLRIAAESGRSLFDPLEVEAALISVGAIAPSPSPTKPSRSIAREQMKLIERFVRAYNRANPVCTSDEFMKTVFTHSDWSELERMLVESGVVSREAKDTGGQPKTFLRRQVLSEELIAGANASAIVPDSVRAFWNSVEARFPG